MYRFYTLFLTLLALPSLTYAQTSAQGLIKGILGFTNAILIPFLIGIAFVFVVINIIRFFVIGAANDESRTKAKNLAIYGVAAFVIIVIFWGTVNLLTETLGLNEGPGTTIDYFDAYDGESPTFKNRQRTPDSGGETAGNNSQSEPCTQLQRDFDNEFGGPCATTTNSSSGSNNGSGTEINESDRGFFESVFDGVVEDKSDPCSDGADFTTDGRPCGIN